MTSTYHIGFTRRVIIETDSGDTVEINGAEVDVEVIQETLSHYSFASGVRARDRVVNERSKVSIRTADNVGDDLLRLIRED